MPQKKYLDKNPISVYLVSNFFKSLGTLLNIAINESKNCRSYLEIGCGEGELFKRLNTDIKDNFETIFGCDIDTAALTHAKTTVDWATFHCTSIYDVPKQFHDIDIAVCCEVLEHLHNPHIALDILAETCKEYAIISVPREPLWKILNMARGKYLRHFGNTPGHINHWSQGSMQQFLKTRFDIVQALSPLPWLMYLVRPKNLKSSL